MNRELVRTLQKTFIWGNSRLLVFIRFEIGRPAYFFLFLILSSLSNIVIDSLLRSPKFVKFVKLCQWIFLLGVFSILQQSRWSQPAIDVFPKMSVLCQKMEVSKVERVWLPNYSNSNSSLSLQIRPRRPSSPVLKIMSTLSQANSFFLEFASQNSIASPPIESTTNHYLPFREHELVRIGYLFTGFQEWEILMQQTDHLAQAIQKTEEDLIRCVNARKDMDWYRRGLEKWRYVLEGPSENRWANNILDQNMGAALSDQEKIAILNYGLSLAPDSDRDIEECIKRQKRLRQEMLALMNRDIPELLNRRDDTENNLGRIAVLIHSIQSLIQFQKSQNLRTPLQRLIEDTNHWDFYCFTIAFLSESF